MCMIFRIQQVNVFVCAYHNSTSIHLTEYSFCKGNLHLVKFILFFFPHNTTYGILKGTQDYYTRRKWNKAACGEITIFSFE